MALGPDPSVPTDPCSPRSPAAQLATSSGSTRMEQYRAPTSAISPPYRANQRAGSSRFLASALFLLPDGSLRVVGLWCSTPYFDPYRPDAFRFLLLSCPVLCVSSFFILASNNTSPITSFSSRVPKSLCAFPPCHSSPTFSTPRTLAFLSPLALLLSYRVT